MPTAPLAIKTVEQFARYGGFIGVITATLVVLLATAVVMLWRKVLAQQGENKVQAEVFQRKLEATHASYIAKLEQLQAEYRHCIELANKERLDEIKSFYAQTREAMADTASTLRALTSALTNLKDAVANGEKK